MEQIQYKGHTIERWWEICNADNTSWGIDTYETKAEAIKAQRDAPAGTMIRACCAEIISEMGDLNPSCKAGSMPEAMNKLKKALN